ncbi:MAG: copper homeostasis protein CutC [Gemmatimonadetes bacterium]|nr:copper homeostasis protein CutC [Gemmatimonadota bacterium]
MLLEACIDDIASAHAAIAGGAGRLELCDNLGDGGTTPSHGVLGYLLDTFDIPVYPIIRPRGGGFCYSREERRIMARDVAHAHALGARGVVVGALTEFGEIDVDAMHEIVPTDLGLDVTFHRAFDLCADPLRAIDTLLRLGVGRVLTSGQRETAWEGRHVIADVVRLAGPTMVIMAGGGIREDHVEALVRETGVREIHVRAATLRIEEAGWDRPTVPFRRALPENELARYVTDPARIGAIRAAAARGVRSES